MRKKVKKDIFTNTKTNLQNVRSIYTPVSGSGFAFWKRIRIQQLKLMRILSVSGSTFWKWIRIQQLKLMGILSGSCSVADPGSGAFLTPWIRDPGWIKSKDPDPGWTTRNIFPKSFETIFWVQILKLFDADPGSGMEESRIRDPG